MSLEQSPREKYIEQAPAVARDLVGPHVLAPGSDLDFLPETPRREPGRDPMEYHVEGDILPREYVDKVAEMVVPGYGRTMERLAADPEVSDIFDKTYDLLERGKSVVINTLHIGNIKDIAIALKAADDVLRDKHAERRAQSAGPWQERGWETLFVINKAMTEAGIVMDLEDMNNPVVAGIIPTLQILCDHIYLPWPKTGSSERALNRLPGSEVSRHNAQVIMGIEKMLKRGHVLGAIALTGTTRVQMGKDGKSRLSPIRDTSARLMVGSYMLPMTAALDRPDPAIHPCSRPVLIEKPEQVDEMTQMMVDDYNHQAPGLNLVYESPRM